jgi:hypothetical protein
VRSLFDTIGATYTVTRRTEPRIAAQVWAPLGDARKGLGGAHPPDVGSAPATRGAAGGGVGDRGQAEDDVGDDPNASTNLRFLHHLRALTPRLPKEHQPCHSYASSRSPSR